MVALDSGLDTVEVLLLLLPCDDERMVQRKFLLWYGDHTVLKDTTVITAHSLWLINHLILVPQQLLVLIILRLEHKVKVVHGGVGVKVVDLMSGTAESVLVGQPLPGLLPLGQVGGDGVADAFSARWAPEIVIVLIFHHRVWIS